MKIDYVLSSYPSKPTIFVYREIKELIRNGHDVRIISLLPKVFVSNKKKYEVIDNIDVLYPSSNPLSYLVSTLYCIFTGKSVIFSKEHFSETFYLLNKKNIFKLIYCTFLIDNLIFKINLNKISIKHIHSHHLFFTTYIAYQISKKINAPFSTTLYTLSYFYPKNILKAILKKNIFIRTTTSELAPFYNGIIQDRSKFHHISNGIHSKEFTFNPSYKIGEILKIIAVGSLLDKKGFDTLIFSCLTLKEYGLNFDCKIIGDGPEKKFLNKLIKSLNLEKYIKIYTWIDNSLVLKKISDSDILVMPCRLPKKSTRDGLPNVIIEAMASGTIVIGSRFAGIPDIIKHKESGLLISPENADEITNAIIEIYFDNTLREYLINNALNKIKTEYSLEPNIFKLQQLFLSSDFLEKNDEL